MICNLLFYFDLKFFVKNDGEEIIKLLFLYIIKQKFKSFNELNNPYVLVYFRQECQLKIEFL